MSKGQLGQTIGVSPETLQRFSRAYASNTQNRLKEMLEIVGRVTHWAGGMKQAMAWYRAEPIASFGGRTAEFLVKDAVVQREFRNGAGGFRDQFALDHHGCALGAGETAACFAA